MFWHTKRCKVFRRQICQNGSNLSKGFLASAADRQKLEVTRTKNWIIELNLGKKNSMFYCRLRTTVDTFLRSEQNSSLVVAKYLSLFDIKLHFPVNSVTSWCQSFLNQSLRESKTPGTTLSEMVFFKHISVLLKTLLYSVKKHPDFCGRENVHGPRHHNPLNDVILLKR